MLKHDRNLWSITVKTLLLDVTLHSGLGYITFSPAFGVFMKEDDSSHDSPLLYCTSLRMFGFRWQDYILNTQMWLGHIFFPQFLGGGFFFHPPSSPLPLLVAQKLAVLQAAQPTMEIQSLSVSASQRSRGCFFISLKTFLELRSQTSPREFRKITRNDRMLDWD